MSHKIVNPLLACLVGLLVLGCPNAGSLNTAGTGSGGDVSESALNYAGTTTGSVATTSSTAGDSAEAGRKIATYAISSTATVWLTDLNGNPLLDSNGNEYPHFPLNTNGTFNFSGLPVGVDIVVNIDLDGDGTANLTTIINIPKDAVANTGNLDNTVIDPLSTLTLAKLKALLEARGIDPRALDLSLSALIERIRDAYENLYGDAGVDEEITLEDILGLSPEDLARLFGELLPEVAQRGMRMAENNMALAVAEDVEDVMQAVAQILIQGGFVIADDPGGVDFSYLDDLPNVESMTLQEWNAHMGMLGPPEQSAQLSPPPGDSAIEAADPIDNVPMNWDWEPTLYFSTLGEPDRNYSEVDNEQGFMPKPWFGEFILRQISQLYLDGKTITLGNLHRVLVDAEHGAGMRLTYSHWFGPDQPPIDVFESVDGGGVERDMFQLFEQIESSGLMNPDPDQWERNQTRIRQILANFLDGTAEPSFERLFGPILMERIPNAGAVARIIREARAHLPFSRSGPSRWYVVAATDRHENPNAQAVTVNIQRDSAGEVTKVTYDPTGLGKYYLMFGPWEEDGGLEVGLVLRRSGKMLHNKRGEPFWLQMADGGIFSPVGGQSFYQAFSETRTEFPTGPALRVPNHEFDPSLPPDPETNPPDWEIWTLMTEMGPDGIPVRANYADGVATYNQAGQYFVVPAPDWWENGLFELIDETGDFLLAIPGDFESCIQITPDAIQGITLTQETWTWVFDIDVPNPGYDSDGAPFYDDINNNNIQDHNEPTFSDIAFLWDPSDWRSTNIETYYRRADTGGFVNPEDVDWESETPQLQNGVRLVPRIFKPRLNAYKFGRPSTAINLLMAFSPPELFNGTQSLNADTRINPFQAVALIDLVFESIQNIEAEVDWDGPLGPAPPHMALIDAWFFVPPFGDPVQLLADGLMEYME